MINRAEPLDLDGSSLLIKNEEIGEYLCCRHHHGKHDYGWQVEVGTAHTFGNASENEARLLVVHTPAMDAYFAGLHEVWNGAQPPTTGQERELMSRFGMEPA